MAAANYAIAGFGVSPPTVLNKNLLPGSSDEQIIYIVQSEPKETLSAQVKISAGEATSWVGIENGNSFEIPKGIQQFPMKVKISVPSDAKLGQYKGTIELLTSSTGSSKQSAPVKVNLGAQIEIDLEVTNSALVDYNIQGFSIKDAGKGEPIILGIKIQNRGNAPAGPTKATVAFYDIYHSEKLWEGQKEILEKVESFSIKDINVELPNNLDLGQYWADVEVFDGEESIIKTKIVFTVVEPLKSGRQAVKLSFSPLKYLFIINIVGALIAAGLAVWIFIKILKKSGIKIQVSRAKPRKNVKK